MNLLQSLVSGLDRAMNTNGKLMQKFIIFQSGSGVMKLGLCLEEHHNGYKVRFILLFLKTGKNGKSLQLGVPYTGLLQCHCMKH